MILTTIAIVAQATPGATATPAPDPKKTAMARAWFVSLQHGKVLDASQLDDKVAALLTADTLTALANQVGPLGDPTAFEQTRTKSDDANTYYMYDVTFKTGDHLAFIIAYDTTGKISGLRVLPPQ